MRLGHGPTDNIARQFSDWTSVQSYWDIEADRLHVRLTLEAEQLEECRRPFLGISAGDVVRPYDRRIRKGPKRGARGAYG